MIEDNTILCGNGSMQRWLMLLLAIIIVVLLFLWNQYDLDCIDDMPCHIMKDADNIKDRIDKLASIPVWRQSLITAIIVTIPIVFIYRCDIPCLWDWVIIVPLVFLVSYFSYSWIMYHFYQPNVTIINMEIDKLEKKGKDN